MGEKMWRWVMTQGNHSNQYNTRYISCQWGERFGEQTISDDQWELCGHEMRTWGQSAYSGRGREYTWCWVVESWALKPDRCPFQLLFGHLPVPFPHLQNRGGNDGYFQDFLLMLNGKSPFLVCNTHQGIENIWVPITSHTEWSGPGCVTIRRVLV